MYVYMRNYVKIKIKKDDLSKKTKTIAKII